VRLTQFFTLISLLTVQFDLSGCAQKIPEEKPFRISPVSSEESHLIHLRLESGEAPRPYEQVELGSSSGLKGYPNTEPRKSSTLFSPLADHPVQSPVQSLVQLIESLHQASGEYFKNNPADQQLYLKLQSNIAQTRCFDDGTDIYCGPGLLSGAIFLLDQSSWKTLHHWLTAIASTLISAKSEDANSAAFQDFVRYFDFGIFKPLQTSSRLLTVANCFQAQEQLEIQGEKPNEWEMNPCKLVLAHKKTNKTGRI